MSRVIKFRAWDREKKEMLPTFLNLTPKSDVQKLITVQVSKLLTCELMQFTGLQDKNDKEIYEGDILEIRGTYYDTRREPVTFDMYAFMAGGRFLADFGNYFSVEVIGNIYEHPELLKAG